MQGELLAAGLRRPRRDRRGHPRRSRLLGRRRWRRRQVLTQPAHRAQEPRRRRCLHGGLRRSDRVTGRHRRAVAPRSAAEQHDPPLRAGFRYAWPRAEDTQPWWVAARALRAERSIHGPGPPVFVAPSVAAVTALASSRGCGGGTSVYVGNDVSGRSRPPTCNGAGQRHRDTISQPFAGDFDGSSTNIGSRASDLSKLVAATVIRGVNAVGSRILGVGSDIFVPGRPPSTRLSGAAAAAVRPPRSTRAAQGGARHGGRQQHVDDPAIWSTARQAYCQTPSILHAVSTSPRGDSAGPVLFAAGVGRQRRSLWGHRCRALDQEIHRSAYWPPVGGVVGRRRRMAHGVLSGV